MTQGPFVHAIGPSRSVINLKLKVGSGAEGQN
jgi:hypothetical protein